MEFPNPFPQSPPPRPALPRVSASDPRHALAAILRVLGAVTVFSLVRSARAGWKLYYTSGGVRLVSTFTVSVGGATLTGTTTGAW